MFGQNWKVVLSGDMLNGGGGVNSASLVQVCCTQGMFRELSGILTKKDVLMKLKGKAFVIYVSSAVVYGSAI